MASSENVTKLRSITWAVDNGSRRDLLVALRARLWEALNDERTQPRDLSPLALRLKELQAEIADIDHWESEDSIVANLPDEPFDPESI